jgi:hypothetical protein
VIAFDRLKLPHHAIILGVRNLRRIEPAEQVHRFVNERQVWGLTVPHYQVLGGAHADLLVVPEQTLYVHTINDPADWLKLKEMGVFGIYTDTILEAN